mmetsp:Transcript_3861/g.15329  ORF Transcript_3861/g.15329 Transcript_3861/m.15329 type:complete len:238 (-) Transcript_3861:4655-5368(-)
MSSRTSAEACVVEGTGQRRRTTGGAMGERIEASAPRCVLPSRRDTVPRSRIDHKERSTNTQAYVRAPDGAVATRARSLQQECTLATRRSRRCVAGCKRTRGATNLGDAVRVETVPAEAYLWCSSCRTSYSTLVERSCFGQESSSPERVAEEDGDDGDDAAAAAKPTRVSRGEESHRRQRLAAAAPCSINQSVNQSFNQSVSQSINQSWSSVTSIKRPINHQPNVSCDREHPTPRARR